MSERRVSTRILSVLLVLCMVFGMVPAGAVTAFAADSTTTTAKTSVTAIREYAAKLLKDNFSKTGSAPDWDTEGKSDTWRYYNGVMLDALLMLGVDSDTDGTVSTNSALEYAKDYMDANIASDGTITDWHAKELDSVPPALTLFALLDTAEVDEATRADYVTAINYVYKQLENQTAYDNCGGNYLHKMDNNSWSTWNIGLDGIYMAQPFLMEYANALAAGKITNTVNSKTAETIQKEVYDRLIWVSEKMYDEDTGLYHHGWNVSGSKGNGHFWSRGIGWYAAGLVMCMDLMPATYQDGLESALTTLFDGMIQYQDDTTGLWYNVVNRDSSLTSNNGNKLETSGTALMAYAMIKAVNEGWVDAKYATSALEAFNGIVANKLKDGKITDIYKSSGVCTSDGDYCKNSYVSDEAKGVGPVLMAAAEVDKYLGTAETFKAGVVVAPDITVALNGTPNYSGVKITVLGSQGTIKDIPYNDSAVSFVEKSTLAVGDTAGTVEVAVVYDDSVIDTFNVTVVDSTVPATGEGTLGIETGTVTVPENPTFTDGDYVSVSSGTGGTGFVLTTTLNENVPYVFTKGINSSSVNGAGYSGGKIAGMTVKGTNSETDGVYSLYVESGSLIYWYVDSANRIYTVDSSSGTSYYLRLHGTSSGNIELTTTASEASEFNFTVSSGKIQLTDPDYNRNAYINSSGFTNASAGASNAVYAFAPQTAGDPVYAKLTGSEGFVYGFGVVSSDIVADIKASTAFKVLVADNADGTDATEVAMSDALVTVEKNSDYKNDEAKTNNFIVKYDGVQIGTIPVVVYDSTSGTTNYPITVSVTPGAIVATEGDTNKPQLNATVIVDGLNGTDWSAKYSGGSDSVATVTEDGLVTIVGEGTATITATVVAITYDGKTYDSNDFGTITVDIPVTVNAKADDTHTHSYTGAETQAPTCTQTGVMTYTCSCGNSYTSTIPATGHSYSGQQTKAPSCTEKGTMTYTCSVCGDSYTEDIAMTDHNYVDGACSVCGAADPDYVAPGIESITAPGNTTGKATVTAGNTLQLTANTVGGATVAWSSGDETIAEVSDTGLVTGKTPGTAVITATVVTASRAVGDSATFEVTVTEAVTVDGNVQTTVTTGGSGATYTHNFTQNGTTSTYYTFKSTNTSTSYGTHTTPDGVNSNVGLKTTKGSSNISFTAGTAGTLTIVAVSASNDGSALTIGGKEYALEKDKATTTITVDLTAGDYEIGASSKDAYVFYVSFAETSTSGGTTTETKYNATLTVDPSSLSMTVGGDTVTLAPSVSAVLAADNTTTATVDQSSYTVTWTPNNTGVVTVDSDGKVTAVGAGETTITGVIAKDSAMKVNGVDGTVLENITVTVPVTVAEAAPVTVTSAALNKTTLEVANGDAIDTSSVKIVLTMSDGSTVELSGNDLTFTGLPTDTTAAGTTTAKVSATYNETDYEFDLSVVVAEAVTDGFVLDTSGSVNMNGGEYIIVAKNGDKYYALQNGDSAPVEVSVTNGVVDIAYANAAKLIWIFNDTHIYNTAGTSTTDDDRYLRNDSAPSKGNSNDKNSKVTVVDAATGAYAINLENSGRYLYYDGSKFTRAGSSDGAQTIYLYKWTGSTGTETVVPSSATVSPATINVANSGTIDMSGVTMEVTMSDGSKKTIANADLTYDVSSINTALAGTYTVPVSYTENGKTVSANVSVVVAAASSGGTTSDLWKHNFSEDGKTDADGFFTIKKGSGEANLTTSYNGTYGDLEFDTALKMESDTTVTFNAPSEGTLTLVFNTDSKSKDVKINGKVYTIDSDGILTIDVDEGEVTIAKDDSTYLFYVEYASALVDGITLTAPNTMYIGAVNGSLNPTHEMQYVVRHNDTTLTEGYTIEWATLDTNVATIDENGVLTAVNPGTTSITAKLTITADGTEYDAVPVLVTVVGPGVSTTEELTLIKGEASLESQKIASTVYAGGVTTTNYELGYKSSDETVATVAADGTVTAVGVGTATIYTYIKSVNGITVYDGDGTSPQPAYFDSTAVTVSNKELVNATLNSYDYVVYKNNWSALLDALSFKENVAGNVVDDSGVALTLEYNTGSTEVIEFHEVWAEGDQVYESNGLRIDLSGVDMTTPGIYAAPITYTDDQDNEIFRDTLWIHVLEFDPNDFDGTLTKEDGIHYILHTGAFTQEDANHEYVIVAENADIAFKNPSETTHTSTTAAATPVIKGFGQVKSELDGTYLYGGAEVNYLTMNESDGYLSEWLLDTLVDTDTTDNVVQLNMSNFSRYIGGGTTQTQLIHDSTKSVQLVTLDEATGESQIILGYGANNQPYYLGYVDGIWTATTEECSVYLYYKDIEYVQDYGIDFDLYDKDYDLSKLPIAQESTNFSEMVNGTYTNVLEIPDGFVYESVTPVIVWNEINIIDPSKGHTYTIEWSSSNTNVATVDQNGVITAIGQGEAIITATLYDINGNIVICNTHNTEHICTTMKVEVTSSTPVPVLTPDELTIGVGTMPNFNKVAVRMTFGENGSEYDYDVPFDQLVFKLADATNTAGEVGFDNTVIDTYQVPVTYAGDTFTLTVHVVEDPYAGLDEAESIPGYPDAGSVRMQKFANGVLDFTSTGVTKIELNAAGISTKSSVDVVLIVDVSNSMGWSMTWFDGMSDSEVSDATDSVKIPSNGADGTDKLDIAMQTATEFADILLNVPGGDNTMTFVTFAGADRDHGGSSDNVDSVRTPMVAISDYATAAGVFADTKFTSLTQDGTGAKYTLQIGGYSDDGYGEAKVSGSNRGNTNYDYAFGEAMDAIAQIKAKYAANNNGASYDESGRQLHVIFMTDGAPSHYNNQRGNGNAKDTLWDGSGDTYTDLSNNSEANWLTYIKNYNELATKLLPMIDGAYNVGFDMAHGGFGKYSYELADMQRVLEGLAKNTVVPTTLAENEQELDDYMTSLALALAYAGTNGRVTDQIGENFSLFTGVNMYSKDITNGIMTDELYNQMAGMSFPITVYSYRLVVSADIGNSLSVIKTDGTVETVTVDESHLGLRVNEDPEVLEQITFSADGTEAYSDVLGAGVNIMTINSKGERVIDASTFTYTATLDIMTVDGVEVTHAADEQIIWKIGNITDREVSMQYYAYLDGSLDNPREAVSGVYATNEYAYLEYVDVEGKYVKRDFGVPQIAWGKANVTVRFYLVNDKGEFVNRAGVTFTNPANRLFLTGRTQYEAELNNQVEFDAQAALVKAGLAATNVLFDPSVHVTVVNSTNPATTDDGVDFSNGTAKEKGLLFYADTSNGFYSNVIVDIPVILTDLGESDNKMFDKSVVIDYGKEIVFDPFDATYEAPYKSYTDGNTKYEMSLVGFANYNADHDLKDYVPATGYVATLNTANGSYKVSDGKVSFTPTRMLSEVEKVFAAVYFKTYTRTSETADWTHDISNDHYMYKLVSIIPATSVYYETDFANGVFTLNGSWTTRGSGAEKDGPQDFVEIGTDDCYGYDESYANDNGYSNYSSAFATGTALADGKYTTTASFSFTGTGFDIISKTGANDGAIVVTITQDGSDFRKKITVINKGENDLYQIPVISVEDLAYGTYNVEIGVAPAVTYPEALSQLNRGGDFYFDAVRIYNPAKGNTVAEDTYVKDNEANTQLFEIRGLLVNPVDASIKVSGVSFIDKESGEATLDDYASIGPNNELYINGNSAIAFAISWQGSAPTSIDIGAKSIISGQSANLTAYISGVSTQPVDAIRNVSVSSATAQFYELVNKSNAADFSAINTAYVFIENNGTGVLSLTDIKVAFGNAAATASIDFSVDQEVLDFANACATFGDVDEDPSTEETESVITQKGRTLGYEDLIYVIDIFDLKGIEGIDLTKDAGLMIWTEDEFEALNGTLVFDEAHANAGLMPYEGEEGFYYGISDGIFTRDLHKKAYYAGYVKQADGSYIFSEAKLYSPAIYAYNMLEKAETSDDTRNLCVALLNYISAAQKYFHDTADADLVNADLTAEQKALTWDAPELNLASEVPSDKNVARDSKVFTGAGKNLLFEEMISLVSVYKIDNAIVENAAECGTIFWTAEQFAALDGIPGVDNIGDGVRTVMFQYLSKDGQWASCAPAVAAKDMADTEYFILGYVIHEDGTVSYSGVMSYTFEQYINNMADSAAMGEFAMRLYYYERAAKAALG